MRRTLLIVLAAAVLAALAPQGSAQEIGPTLTLDDAIGLALKRNRDLKVASYLPGIARANLLAARGQFDPSLVLNRSTAGQLTQEQPGQFSNFHTDTYGVAFQGQLPTGTQFSLSGNTTAERDAFIGLSTTWQTYGGISVVQPLLKGFGFGANLLNVRIAKANRSINDLSYRQSAIDTVTNVVVAYSNLQLAHDELNAAQRAHALAFSLFTDNEKRFKVGSTSQSDVIAARAYAAQFDESIIIAERGVRDAQNQLRSLIGDDTFFEDEPLFTLVPMELPEVTIDRKADLSRALISRPDYQQQRLAIVKSHASEAFAANGLLPQVNFVGNFGYNGVGSTFSASRAQVDERLNHAYGAGLTVTLPITFAVGRGNLRSARLQREQTEAALRQLEATIALNVATVEGQIEATRRRVDVDRAALALAKQALEAEQKKQKAGSSSTLAVVQQQTQVVQVENSIAFALAAERQAVANYDRELGMTLERRHIRLTGD